MLRPRLGYDKRPKNDDRNGMMMTGTHSEGSVVADGEGGGDDDLLGGWDASAARKPRKRSLSIAGHRTSISLEEPFWEGLRQAAAARSVSIASMVAAIDAVRGDASLSSAIRVFVLQRSCGAITGKARRR